ncbi:MAG: hypothetical protein A2V45_01890 [Candidatus Aminicenantes bacterium RBG_19FT_COMBO_58_17]|nr:MAG: hypothetical protein A2V45_01890 [Candidatus Aminicenantes bacterium RBG_19FT_COMBO_58_17]
MLVPREALVNELIKLGPKLNVFRKMAGNDEEILIQAVSRLISNKFKVSPEVIYRRIRIEKAWPFR